MKRSSFFVFGALLFAATGLPSASASAAAPVPATAPDASATPDAPQRATLANGLRVIVLPNRLAPVAMTLMIYGVGTDDDTKPGIAHATEHMLFRGTPELSAGQLADVAARMGASYNALTANQQTVFYYEMPAAYVDLALRIEADRMTHATIKEADWATERGAIEQEVRALEGVPGYKIGLQLRNLFFGDTPFTTGGPGTPDGFEHMSAGEIRAFYHTWYHPGNATLIVAGDVDATQTLAAARAHFDAIPAIAVPVRKPFDVPELVSAPITASMDFPVGFGALAYRLPGSNAPDYAASLVLDGVFSGGRSALTELMLTGKTLVAFNLSNSFPEMGADFMFAVPAAGQPPQSVHPLLSAVLDDYRTNGVPPELIEAAKDVLLSRQAYSSASISGLGLAWAHALEINKPDPGAVYREIAAVTPDDVNRVLRTYFTPAHQLSITVSPKPSGSKPSVDPSQAAEHVGFTPSMHAALPAWAQVALKAPLRAPADRALQVRHLPNGLEYATRHESVASTVTLHGYIRTSPELYEPRGKDGVALVTAGLLGWGSQTYDRKAYQAQLDAIQARVTLGSTFALEVRSKDFERGVELLADAMLHPAFPSDGFAVMKENEKQAVAITNALPKTKADLAQRLALYAPGDPRRRDVTPSTVASVGLDDVRHYYRFAYRPDETTIAIVGDVAPERVDAAMRGYFGAWQTSRAAPDFRYPKVARVTTTAKTVTVKSPSVTQAEVSLREIWRMNRNDPDYVPLELANTILSGEGTGSLLFEELRTRRGFVYSPDSSFSVDARGAEFSLSFASDPGNVRPAIGLLIAIVKRLQTQPLPAVELQRAKALLLAQRVLPLDSYSGVADDMLSGPKAGYSFDPSERWFWDELLATTPAQLEHAMRRIDPDRFVRVIVEPGS